MKHTSNILITSFLLLLIGSVKPAPCAASDSAEKIDLALFVSTSDLPPYIIKDPGHQERGILVDVLKAVAEPLGYTFTTHWLPNKRGWKMLEYGDVDIHIFAMEWSDQPDKFLWTVPFMGNEDVLLYPAKSRISYTRPEDLYGKTVAAMKGFVYPILEPHFGPGRIKRIDTATPYAMLELVALGRVDAALVNRAETQWMFRNQPELKPERFRLDAAPLDTAWYRFVFPKGHGWESAVEKFNQRIEAMKQDGSLKAILNQYR